MVSGADSAPTRIRSKASRARTTPCRLGCRRTRTRNPSNVSKGCVRPSNSNRGIRTIWSPMHTRSFRGSRRARSNHVRERVLSRMPSTVSISSSLASSVWPITPLRRAEGRRFGLLRCSSVESASHDGSTWHRRRAAVTCEIQAPGETSDSARAVASRSKSQSPGRYSPRPTWTTSRRRSLDGGTPSVRAASKVNGADAKRGGRLSRISMQAL